MSDIAKQGIEKIMRVFCECQLFTDDEISLIKAYFEGGADEILEKLEHKEDYFIGNEFKGVLRWRLNKLMDFAHNDPEIIKKALSYRRKRESYGTILLAVYFLMKYPEAGPEDEAGGLEALIEKQGITGEEARQDIAMMRQYEDLLLSIFREMNQSVHPEDVTDEIEKAIRDDRIDERILKMVADVPEISAKIYFAECCSKVCGMAFVNYALSRRLKNIVLCLAVDAKEMLYTVTGCERRL